MNMLSLVQVLVVDLWRTMSLDFASNEIDINRANLARAGHSVFLIEAGEDHGDSQLQRIPAMYVFNLSGHYSTKPILGPIGLRKTRPCHGSSL